MHIVHKNNESSFAAKVKNNIQTEDVKTHDSESWGQEEAAIMWPLSELSMLRNLLML